jgi:NAD(P)-dependent dehydrogenase (short-subunit alcohol dehydrogenase family)
MATVLITGTSKGIGLEAALAFGRAGHTVFATMRNPLQAPELTEIVAREGLPVKISAMDVDSDESVAQSIAAIQGEIGPLDVLINNAGIEKTGTVEELPLSAFRQVMETNYFGVIRCIQAVAPQMRKRKGGCIVNVSSISGRIANPPLSSYTASKWALEAMTEALAGEMKSFNVRVALVEPGIIDTAMARRISDPAAATAYPQPSRFASLFTASLQHPVPPTLVAEKLLEVVASGTWTLRHPVGPDAVPFMQWRAQMTDEEWVELNGSDDETWYARVERDFGMNTRPAK